MTSVAAWASVEQPITCAANTLVIVNNAGFHRRGRIEGAARRRTLWVNFYPFQRPATGGSRSGQPSRWWTPTQ